nr:MAG TPA: hypothetical protein [Caudoviricetes sp.]
MADVKDDAVLNSSNAQSSTNGFKVRLINGLENFKNYQDKALDRLGLKNITSGNIFTQSDITKLTANPYLRNSLRKLDNLKFFKQINKFQNSQAFAIAKKAGLGSFINGLSGDGISQGQAITRTWSIVDDNNEKVVPFDNFLGIDVKNEGKVISSPTENGSFVSYNKTQSPIEIQVVLGIQGTPETITSAISALTDLQNSDAVVSLITPDQEYKSLTLNDFDYHRDSETAVDLLTVNCKLTEVRQFKSEYTNTKLAKRKSRGQTQKKPESMLNSMLSKPVQSIRNFIRS